MKAIKTMMLILILAATSLTLVAATDDSGPMDGTWLVTIQTANGPVSGLAELSVEDNHITGKLTTDAGEFKVDGTFNTESARIYVAGGEGATGMVLAGARTAGAVSGTAKTFGGDEVGSFGAQRR